MTRHLLRAVAVALAISLLSVGAAHAARNASGATLWNEGKRVYLSGNHAGAVTYIRRAAEAGYPTAVYEMGYLYENGDGVPRNMAMAARWYMKGAGMGEARAEAAVGLLYEDGIEVPDNWLIAAQWYEKSAAQGARKGEFRLARAFQYGIGVPLDLNKAVYWYEKAAAQGDGQAAYFARYIRNNHGFDGSSALPQEQQIMGPYMTQPWYLHRPPTGRVFRSTADRLNYFRIWARNAAAYEACMSRHFNTSGGVAFRCPAPVPPR
ncbi:MAG: tetratricopeptide repeat protein [Stellaceae bacterium]